jgi:hypothetical protein
VTTQDVQTNGTRAGKSSTSNNRLRRSLIAAAAIAVLAAAFGTGALVGTSQAGDEPASVNAPDIVRQWGQAFVAEDREALAALYAEPATFSCRAFDFTIDSREIVDVVMHDATDFTQFEPTSVIVGDEMIVAEYDVVAISPSGKDVSTPLIAVFDVAPNGLLAASTIDYDRAAMFPG